MNNPELLQKLCDKYAFQIYEYNKIKGDRKTLAIREFWMEYRSGSISKNTIVYTPFNKLTFTNESVLLVKDFETGLDGNGIFTIIVNIEELDIK